jgi:RNA 2',3'-cyclic 3'-phosphodiesterase
LSGDRVRSFIAVDLDDAEIKNRIAKAQHDLEGSGASLKPVSPEIMHLTLRFLGEIPQSTVQHVIEAMNGLHFPPFEVEFSGVGVFPNIRRISVVWIGITRGQERLVEIFEQLEPKLRQIGLPPDNKGFSPHMTVARVKSGLNKDALAQSVENMREIEFGKMAVDSVRLKKSTLTPRGPIYTTMHEVKATS